MEQTQTGELSLQDQLAQQTEFKAPSDIKTSGWSFDNVDEEENPTEEGSEGDKAKEHKTIADNLKKPKVSEEEKKISAETATAAIDSLLEMICVPIIEKKYRKRFTPEELDKGEQLEDKAIETLSDPDKLLKQKWDRLMKKRDAKVKAIPLSPKEENRLEKTFYNYFKIKDIAMPPEWLLYIGLTSTLADRIIEVATD